MVPGAHLNFAPTSTISPLLCLENLSTHGPFGSAAVYGSVAGLVRRSGCSLRQLGVDPGDGDREVLQNILDLSPELVKLEITLSATHTLRLLAQAFV
jgi:hypothetical protein